MLRSIFRCWRTVLACATLLALLSVAWNLKHPLLYGLRACETAFLLAVAVLGGSATRLCRLSGRCSASRQRALGCGMLALATLTVGRELEFQFDRQRVLAGGREMRAVGRHFIVGFRTLEEVEALAVGGLIGGLYLTRRNLWAGNVATLAAGITRLQHLRRAAGLPPLIVAADQEGGRLPTSRHGWNDCPHCPVWSTKRRRQHLPCGRDAMASGRGGRWRRWVSISTWRRWLTCDRHSRTPPSTS